MQSKHIVKLYS